MGTPFLFRKQDCPTGDSEHRLFAAVRACTTDSPARDDPPSLECGRIDRVQV